MDRSMMSMIYFVALLALFLILIIATIAVIVSKSKRRYDDEEFEEEPEYTETAETVETDVVDSGAMLEDAFYAEEELPSESDEDDAYFMDEESGMEYTEAEETTDELDELEDDFFDSAFAPAMSAEVDPVQANAPTQEIDIKAVKEERKNTNIEMPEETGTDVEWNAPEIPVVSTGEEIVGMSEETETERGAVPEVAQAETIPVTSEAEQTAATPVAPETAQAEDAAAMSDGAEDTITKKPKKKHGKKVKKSEEPLPSDAVEPKDADDFSDSAFAPDIPGIHLSNEAIAASVREAEAMGAAIMGDLKAAQVPVETMFGINEQLSSYGTKKNKRAKSNVSSDDDFYWYNKEDAAERPARRPIEAYYHHFNLAADCIEDLLVEMYDCALVRTEEIRYIAYGIEPRTLTMKEIMSGAVSLSAQKKKEPTEQDIVRIYEKWCGYVDRLLDKIEIHADEYTIQEIRKQLCEYGRNDVDTLLEGK